MVELRRSLLCRVDLMYILNKTSYVIKTFIIPTKPHTNHSHFLPVNFPIGRIPKIVLEEELRFEDKVLFLLFNNKIKDLLAERIKT